MTIRELTAKLLAGEPLTQEDAARAAHAILEESVTPVQVAAFLTALRARGESAETLVGFARVMSLLAEPFQAPEGIILDTCGTGGDHSGTFNISTATAFVVAGAGVRVAKHGNRSVTSQCGSADVLRELGVAIDSPRELMEQALRQIGICFLFAPQYHKAMKVVAEIRRELGFRTIFNMLGPLLNPARATHQIVGVFNDHCFELYVNALKQLGRQRALVVHGSDGLDEITTTGATHVAELNGDAVSYYELTPEQYGFPRASLSDLRGGSAVENARIVMEILEGNSGPRTDVVLFNAGAALYIASACESIAEGIKLARRSLASGAARAKLEQLRQFTTKGGATLP